MKVFGLDNLYVKQDHRPHSTTNFTSVHLFRRLQSVDVVVHKKEGGTYEGPTGYAHATTFFLPYGATSNAEEITGAMTRGSVQSSPILG